MTFFKSVTLTLAGIAIFANGELIPKEHNPALCEREPTFDPYDPDVITDFVDDESTEYCPKERENYNDHYVGQITTQFFENTEKKPVELYWLNENGVEVLVKTIPPGETELVKTREGHIFHVRLPVDEGVRGQLLLRHRVGKFSFRTKSGIPCTSQSLEPLPEVDHTDAPGPKGLGCNYIAKTFTNRVGCPINVFHVDKNNNEVLIAQLGSYTDIPVNEFLSSHKFQATYVGHTFRARLEDGGFIEDKTVDKVRIGPCPLKSREPIAIQENKMRFEIRNTNDIHLNETEVFDDMFTPEIVEITDKAVSWQSSTVGAVIGKILS